MSTLRSKLFQKVSRGISLRTHIHGPHLNFDSSDLRKRHIRKCHPQTAGVVLVGSTEAANKPSDNDTTVSDTTSTRILSTAQEPRPRISGPDVGRTPANDEAEHWRSDSPNGQAQVPSIPTNIFSQQNVSWLFKLPQFITTFFEKFQASFPILHQQSFDLNFTNEPLLQAMACIGAVYHSLQFGQNVSFALFEAGLKSLDTYVWSYVLLCSGLALTHFRCRKTAVQGSEKSG